MKVRKKLILITIAVSVLVGALSGCQTKKNIAAGSTKANNDTIKVRIGGDSSTFSLQFHVADEQGFFKKYGIEPEITTYSYGIDTLNAALTDQVDIGEAMDFAALSRFSAGDLKIISFNETGKAEKSKLVARDNVKTVGDLKGKKIGQQKATVNEYVWAKYLDKVNIKTSEIIPEGLTSTTEVFAAFERGDVSAAFFSGTFLDKALSVQGAHVIGTQADIPLASRGFIVATGKFLKEKPEAAERILKALDEATKWIKDNNEGAAEIAFKKLKLPKDSVAREINDLTYDIRLTQEDVAQLKDVNDYAVKNNLIKGGFELKDKIYIDALKKALPDKLTYDPAK